MRRGGRGTLQVTIFFSSIFFIFIFIFISFLFLFFYITWCARFGEGFLFYGIPFKQKQDRTGRRRLASGGAGGGGEN